MAPTQYTEQQAWNVLAGNSPNTLHTGQEVVNLHAGNSPITLVSEQRAANQIVGNVTTLPEQATIINNLKTLLSLNGSPTQYTLQVLLNMAIGASLTLTQVLGG